MKVHTNLTQLLHLSRLQHCCADATILSNPCCHVCLCLPLQDAYSALEALPTGSSLVSEPAERSSLNVPENCQTLQLPQQAAAPVDDAAAITAAQAAGTPGIPEASHPAVRALASVVLQLSQAELLLAKLQLQAGDRGKAATEPEFPRVEGRNPQAVIAYLSAVANAAQVRPMPGNSGPVAGELEGGAGGGLVGWQKGRGMSRKA